MSIYFKPPRLSELCEVIYHNLSMIGSNTLIIFPVAQGELLFLNLHFKQEVKIDGILEVFCIIWNASDSLLSLLP